MKIIRLHTNPDKYSSNSYLVMGTYNTIEDVNAIIDTGYDDYIYKHINKIYTGVGKKAVDKIVITHNHFDHNGGIIQLKERYQAKTYAFLTGNHIDHLLEDGEEIKLADCFFQVVHTPGHSQDSICLYCKKEGILFSGDTTIRVYAKDSSYSTEYIKSIEKLIHLKVTAIYPGHGEPYLDNPQKILRDSYEILTSDKIN